MQGVSNLLMTTLNGLWHLSWTSAN